MKKIVSFLFIVAIFAGWKIYNTFDKTPSTLPELNLKCHLSIEDCVYNYQGALINVSLTPKPLRAMNQTLLKISGLTPNLNLKAKIKGTNMYMGEINVDFSYQNGNYEGIVIFSNCIHDMIYRVEFFNEDIALNFSFDIFLRV
ncbi:hypothetical protein F1B92_01770 [Campylobacter sp. FMV-PI01]|uniref:Periplasmic protein n=1 Tax=Campylobacter portucalensis TaxID=2608384 RepID=A0A6L5WHM1_9BACT|nr:hypothetical protein [Campylobacter portucalensis]MSN95932.1 hypothetical protein [Campylobacter portucalensis]